MTIYPGYERFSDMGFAGGTDFPFEKFARCPSQMNKLLTGWFIPKLSVCLGVS
jgi:hypothetical protein